MIRSTVKEYVMSLYNVLRHKNAYFHYAKDNIHCECPNCLCPNATEGKGGYSFTYIREDINLMYFDVPKAASSTIRKNLYDNNHNLSLKKPKKNQDDYLTFTFVRNPWDRLVSNWKMFTQQPRRKWQLESMVGRSDYSFLEFVEVIESNANHHWLPQSLYVPEDIQFIGRVESFTEDIKRLHTLLDLPYKGEIWTSKQNSTKRARNYEVYFNDNKDLIERVSLIYKEDIERFEYQY